MGISFDLNVEDLPDNIFDAVVAGGYNKQDDYTKGRWDGISAIPGTFVINDIQCANNVVVVCGSYLAFWDATQCDPDVAQYYDPTTVAPNLEWRDGFFAACNFDALAFPEAWHLVCTRSLLEMGPSVQGPPLNITEGGLYSMVIDYRTIAQQDVDIYGDGLGSGGQGVAGNQNFYVTAVGYTAVDQVNISGYSPFAPPGTEYTPYEKSVFDNQDFYPQIFSWGVKPDGYFLGGLPADTTSTTFPGNVASDGQTWDFTPFYFAGLVDDSVQVDQLGRTLHLNGLPSNLPNNQPVLMEDFLKQNGVFWWGCAICPLEQYTYRAHEIGIRQYEASNISNVDPYGRSATPLGYMPTSSRAISPSLHPIEFAFAVPGYQTQFFGAPLTNVMFCPEWIRNVNAPNPVIPVKAQSDALLWRHGYIPRKLKSIYRTQPAANILTGGGASIYYSSGPNEISGVDDRLGTLVIGGECLVQDYDAQGRPTGNSAASSGGSLIYEPLLLYGQNGWGEFSNSTSGPGGQRWESGVFFGFTARNMCVEQTATPSSLTNASIELVAPCMEIPDGITNAVYPVMLGVQISQDTSGNPAQRAEIMVFEPTLANFDSYPSWYAQDWKVVSPFASWNGAWETATGYELGTQWYNVGSQPRDFTPFELNAGTAKPSSEGLPVPTAFNYKRYGIFTAVSAGAQVGRSIILGGNTTRRTPQGTYALAYDYGSIVSAIDPVWNTRTPPTPLLDPFQGFQVLKISQDTDSQAGQAPPELNYTEDLTTLPVQNTNNQYSQILYHIPNVSMNYPNGNTPGGGWVITNSNLEINGYNLFSIYPGSTIPPPTGFYETLSQLATQLNDYITSVRSAFPAGTEADADAPSGLGGLTWKVTSDNKGVYCEADSSTFVAGVDVSQYAGTLVVEDPGGTWNNANNYPYANGVPGGIGINYSFYGGGCATVEPSVVSDPTGCFLDIGETLDTVADSTIAVGSQRFFISGDYDTDRDQWLIALGDLTGGFTVIASTTDYSDMLNQTESFEKNPLDRRNAMLLALNQKTSLLDGVAFAGTYVFCSDGRPSTHSIEAEKGYKITGTTGRTVKVWLNYMLYDGLDSLIAVEVSNLGLRVTPENVLWYKNNIIGADGDEEVTLEEIERWMGLQRQQYQDLLKNKKPVQKDTGSEPKVDDYILDDKAIADLLPELTRLPPNPDSEPTDADMMGNTLSGDIKSVDEKRRETDV